MSGLAVTLAPAVRVCQDGRLVMSARSGRAVRLLPDAERVLSAGGGHAFAVTDATTRTLARALLDRDLAVPVWTPPQAPLLDLTVIVPVRDRTAAVARLLDALPHVGQVLVVDDGSREPDALRAAAAARHARVLRRPVSGGPAAARNTGLKAVGTPFVAFLDSDVVPEAGTLERLRRHLDDPSVAIAGPRVLGLREPGAGDPAGDPRRRRTHRPGWVARYEQVRSCLDLGDQPARVAPGSRISYLPSAAMVTRVAAILDGFDESMEVAEDVDLIWRLVDRGWAVRYCPEAAVRHEHRIRLRSWLARRAEYGTGAALLARRHGQRVAPARLTPTAAMLGVGVLVGGPRGRTLAGCAVAAEWALLTRRGGWVSPVVAARLAVASAGATLGQVAGLITRHHWPLFALAMLGSRRLRRVVPIVACAEAAIDYARVRPDMSPPAYLLARRLDDAAYGWGVWKGAWRARSAAALAPEWLWSGGGPQQHHRAPATGAARPR